MRQVTTTADARFVSRATRMYGEVIGSFVLVVYLRIVRLLHFALTVCLCPRGPYVEQRLHQSIGAPLTAHWIYGLGSYDVPPFCVLCRSRLWMCTYMARERVKSMDCDSKIPTMF